MNRKILTFILTSTWLLFWASPSIALVTEYQKAIDAYKRKDYKTSYNLILPLAEKGFAKAQYNLGVMYGNGKGVAKDYSKAIKWWNHAANQGNGKAQYNLGVMYEEGKGVKKNLKKAANWYQLASNQGHAKAQEKLNLLLNKTKEHLQENTASSNDNPSELNTGSVSFRGDAFDVARYSADTFTEVGNDIDVKFDPFRFGCSQLKNKDQQSECFEKFSDVIAKEKIKKHSILKKNSTSNLTKKLQPGKSRNNSEVITSKDLVSKHLDKWIRAWEKQDIELYLSFYSKEFKGSKERHADWRISRQAALKKHTNISIQLQNIQISQNKDTVGINFTQTFKSDGYSDIGVKELVWAKNGSDWRIIKETWIPHKKTT